MAHDIKSEPEPEPEVEVEAEAEQSEPVRIIPFEVNKSYVLFKD